MKSRPVKSRPENFLRIVLAPPLLTLWVLLAACASVAVEPQRGVTSLTDHVTESGQQFSLAFLPDADKVSIHVIWPNDWAHTSGMPVVGNLGVDLISTDGAGTRTAREISRDITALGGAASLAATPDHIYGTFTSLLPVLEKTMAIVRDVVTEPGFDKERFEVLKQAKQQRVAAQQQAPSGVLWQATRKVLLGDTTLTDYWNNAPVDRTITPLGLDDVRRWHAETFTRAGTHVAVAGNIDAETAAESIDQLLGGLPAGGRKSAVEVQSLNTGVTVLLHDESAPLTLFATVGVLPASREGGEIFDIVAVGALGKGKESRLLKAKALELSEQISIDASIANFSRDIRVFGINAAADNADAKATFQLIEQAYSEFKKGDLDDQEVLRSVVPFANTLRSSDNNVDLLAYGLGQLLLDELSKDQLLTVVQDSLALKAPDINQRVVDLYPEWDELVKVVLSSDPEVVEADCVVKTISAISDCQL